MRRLIFRVATNREEEVKKKIIMPFQQLAEVKPEYGITKDLMLIIAQFFSIGNSTFMLSYKHNMLKIKPFVKNEFDADNKGVANAKRRLIM